MKCLIIGCGSIGERHIKNLKTISSNEILAFDLDKNRLELMKKNYGVKIFNDFKTALNHKPNIVFVCTPPSSHTKIASEIIKNKCHVFIEKPISNSVEGIDEILGDAKKNNLHVFVGYNLRFHKGLKLVKKLLDEKGYIHFTN